MRDVTRWLPAIVLALGVVLVSGVREPRSMPLRGTLAVLPDTIAGLGAERLELSPEELAANGASDYLLRSYQDASGAEQLGLYIGYYASQRQGTTIHSPKNCLPGGGWEPLSSSIIPVRVGSDEVPVNRYIIANRGQRAVVYYWYQGRGRVAADEYAVKWHLLRDATLRARTEEALVRLVVPLDGTQPEADADELARDAAAVLVPRLHGVLPA